MSYQRVCHATCLLCHITGSVTRSVMLQVCCVTSQGVSRHRFVVLHHRVCHRVCHATVFWCHITGSVTGSVMPQVCCVTSQGLSCHRFVVSHHRVCHATGLLCYITEYAERQDGSMLLKWQYAKVAIFHSQQKDSASHLCCCVGQNCKAMKNGCMSDYIRHWNEDTCQV